MKRLFSWLMVISLLAALCVPVVGAEQFYARDITSLPQYTTLDGRPTNAPVINQTEGVVSPRALLWTPTRYSSTPSSYVRNETAYLLGQLNGDNSSGSIPMKLTYAFSTTTTLSGTVTGGVTASAEMQLMVAKAKAEISTSISSSVSFAQGTTLTAEVAVPIGKKGSVQFYNTGYYCGGTMYYTVRDSASGGQWEQSLGLGALLPLANDYGFVYIES